MFIAEAFHALQFDNKHIFDQDVGIVCSYVLALIGDACPEALIPRSPSSLSRARSYSFSRHPAPKVLETSSMAPITRSVSESGHRRSSVFLGG